MYTRNNHFAQRLNALQGCSHSKIPTDIIEIVKEDVNKNEGVFNPSSVKASLRRLGEARYYEDKYIIAEMLSWETPMRDLNKSNLISDFEEFNDAYSKIEKDRVNCFPFSFIMYKLVEKQPDLSPTKKETILEILYEDLPQIYKEWIDPDLLMEYDELGIVLRQVQISELQNIWDKMMGEYLKNTI